MVIIRDPEKVLGIQQIQDKATIEKNRSNVTYVQAGQKGRSQRI